MDGVRAIDTGADAGRSRSTIGSTLDEADDDTDEGGDEEVDDDTEGIDDDEEVDDEGGDEVESDDTEGDDDDEVVDERESGTQNPEGDEDTGAIILPVDDHRAIDMVVDARGSSGTTRGTLEGDEGQKGTTPDMVDDPSKLDPLVSEWFLMHSATMPWSPIKPPTFNRNRFMVTS